MDIYADRKETNKSGLFFFCFLFFSQAHFINGYRYSYKHRLCSLFLNTTFCSGEPIKWKDPLLCLEECCPDKYTAISACSSCLSVSSCTWCTLMNAYSYKQNIFLLWSVFESNTACYKPLFSAVVKSICFKRLKWRYFFVALRKFSFPS